MAKKLSREDWERRIKDAGAGRYEFVRWAIYGEFGAHKKCVIRCTDDGFEWSPVAHDLVSQSRGCPQCAGKRIWTAEERVNQINKLSAIEFISWSGSYKNKESKALVRCTLDGFEWLASVGSLLNTGSGCPHCSGNRRCTPEEREDQINKLGTIEFIRWEDEGYKNIHSKAFVRCTSLRHEWSATVGSLLNTGSGCPRCARYGYDTGSIGYLYALRSECGKYVKVGISNNPERRHVELRRSTPFAFSCIEKFEGYGDKIAELEKHFHASYESAGFVGFDGCTEWLVCSNELLSKLRRLSIEHE